ncbi:hypothetical protein HU718_011055 [Pseudomonas tensinigenes]|uniref:Uncharacterized protein n=1 Tax=Pseudomonas tensinigenes TaxID=2745511 RepID=A0ABX8Q4S9_9PSED|nr:hypothetical protein [Pseudomonas tensinigenes]QXI08201.1 hypothetical protein HU718_011055 [Pseudomonas tensinigenes]
MFEAITYRNAIGPGPLIDIGALAEGLIFYGRVVIAANSATIEELLTRIPPFILLSLLRDGRLEIHYMEDHTGVSSDTLSNGRSVHGLIRFSSPAHIIEKVGPQKFRAAAGNTSQAKIGASQFTRLLNPLSHSGFDQESLLQTFSEGDTIQDAVKALIREVAPTFESPNDFRFKVERERNGQFSVDTNIDFSSLNKIYHRVVPPEHSTITEAYILALVQGAYLASFLAASLNTEIAVHPIEKAVQASAIDSVVRKYTQSQLQIERFADLTLSGGHAIREAVNSGAVPFASVVKLLDSADKFRHWLHQQPADANLVRAYYQETIKDSWIAKLPGKSMRWGIFTGIGLGIDALGAGGLGTATGVAVSAIDSFLADKLVGGWKPHQFVERDLKTLFNPVEKVGSGKG